MGLRHRKQKHDDPEADAQGGKEKEEVDRYSNGDEYEILLRYVADEEQKEKDKQGADDDEDEGGEDKRVWYMPWKKVKVKNDKDKKVPEDWLKTDGSKGLSDGDIDERRNRYGPNELESPPENQFMKFISYFRGPILYVMEIAVVLSAGLQDWIDFGVIIGILMMNAVVGWYQEKQAGDIVAQLKAGIALKTTVIRNGKEQEIEARDVVVGDILVLEEGQTIPADAEILSDYEKKGDSSKGDSPPANGRKSSDSRPRSDASSDHTHFDNNGSDSKKPGEKGGNNAGENDDHPNPEKQDQTTMSEHKPAEDGEKQKSKGGKSEKGEKGEKGDEDDDEDDKAKKGPSVISVDQSAITGESLAVDKYIGETAYYTCQIKRGKCLARVTLPAGQSFVGRTASLVTCRSSNEKGHFQIILVWIGGFFRGIGITTPTENSLLIYALIFFIIGVPVGLPVVSTTTMAVGAAYLARQKCIVQKLTAIEALAGVDVLCTDKTGTLTANKLSLNEPYLGDGVEADWFMTVSVLASSHNVKSLDPIDKVTVLALKDYPGAQENLKSGWKTNKFTPFDPVSKRITAEVEKDGKKYTCAKGAPNAILKLKNFDKAIVEGYRDKAQEFATRGFRSLGVAVKEDGKDWELLGIMSMSDPPRPDTASTIDVAQDLGVKVKMLTGDAVAIGKELARQLHLGTKIFDSEKLIGGSMAGADVRDFVEHADGFAEVFPEHKYQVVEFLQQRGHLVAMTGDGVNDAPSLKKANCGIAVEGASDAARSAAAVVFLDEGLSSIITSMKVARQIFHRLKAYIIYRIALCIHLEVYLAISMLVLNETIRADLVVFLAIFADVATIAVAYDNAPYARHPVEWQLPKVWIMSTILGLILAAGTWICRGTMFLSSGGIIQNFGSVQEVLFLEVALTESWLIFITRIKQTEAEDFAMPSWQLCGAVFGVDVLATLFCVFGWISGDPVRSGRTSVVAAVRIWCFSFGVIVVLAIAYLLLNKMAWLDNLGKVSRSKKDTVLENFLTEMQKMTLKHEKDSHGESFYRFGASSADDNEDSDDDDESSKKDKKEDKKDDKKGKDAKKEDKKEDKKDDKKAEKTEGKAEEQGDGKDSKEANEEEKKNQ
ncbi:plasma-membrane proton-e [Pseudohyphozyma bogoriensis]|nr:plasma-membrane proton-e [Pseudohyphozyma bogoriensis]